MKKRKPKTQGQMIAGLRQPFHKPTKTINHAKIYKRNKRVPEGEL